MKSYSWPFHASTLVFRRSLWNSVGRFDPRYQLADTGWWLRAVLDHNVDFLPESHILNRRHLNNWSNAVGAVKMHDEVNEMALEYIDLLEKIGVSENRRHWMRLLWTAHHEFRTGRLMIARGRAGKVEQCTQALSLFLKSLPLLRHTPQSVITPTGKLLTGGLSRLQSALPGGRKKYDNMGVSIPL